MAAAVPGEVGCVQSVKAPGSPGRASRAGLAAAPPWQPGPAPRGCARAVPARATWRCRVGAVTAGEPHFPVNPGLGVCRKGLVYTAPAGAPLSASPSEHGV